MELTELMHVVMSAGQPLLLKRGEDSQLPRKKNGSPIREAAQNPDIKRDTHYLYQLN
jgi:hypothetical protein